MNRGQALCRISPAKKHKGCTGVGRAGWSLGHAGFSMVGRRYKQNPFTWKCDLMSMSGCQLMDLLDGIRNSFSSTCPLKIRARNPRFKVWDPQHPAENAEVLEEKLLCEHQNSCLVPPLREENALLHPLGLGTHGGGKSEFRTTDEERPIAYYERKY